MANLAMEARQTSSKHGETGPTTRTRGAQESSWDGASAPPLSESASPERSAVLGVCPVWHGFGEWHGGHSRYTAAPGHTVDHR